LPLDLIQLPEQELNLARELIPGRWRRHNARRRIGRWSHLAQTLKQLTQARHSTEAYDYRSVLSRPRNRPPADQLRLRHFPHGRPGADYREAVERLTERKVLALISGNHIDPDIAGGPRDGRWYGAIVDRTEARRLAQALRNELWFSASDQLLARLADAVASRSA